MSMSNLISININIMDMKSHMLINFFISMLMSKERGEIVIRKGAFTLGFKDSSVKSRDTMLVI